MIFKISFGEFKPLLNKKIVTEQEGSSPIFYFESEEEIYLYKPNNNYIVSTSIEKESMENLIDFKREYLVDATELIEKPKENAVFVIRQE